MAKIKEILVASVLSALKEVGKIEMRQVLSGIKEHNDPEVHKNTILSLHINFLLLREFLSDKKMIIPSAILDKKTDEMKVAMISIG